MYKVQNLRTKIIVDKTNKKAKNYFERRSLIDLRYESHVCALEGYQLEPQSGTTNFCTIRKGKEQRLFSEIQSVQQR